MSEKPRPRNISGKRLQARVFAPATFSRLERVKNWARTRWRKIAIAGGIFLLAVGMHGAYRYQRYRTQPWVEVALMGHQDEYDGRVVVKKLRELQSKEKVSVIALELMNSTENENRETIHRFEKMRVQFDQWRAKNHPDPQTLEREARNAARSQTGTPVFIPLYAEALIQRLPIRFLESISSKELERAKKRETVIDQLFQQAANAPTLKESQARMIRFYEILDQETAERNQEMREELAKIRNEFRNKGTVFAATGLAHFEFPPKYRTRVVDAFEEGKIMLSDPRANYHVAPSLRAAREIVGSYLQTALVNNPNQRERLRPAYEMAKGFTLEDFSELDRRIGNMNPNKRLPAVIEILIEWANKR
ncbi:MAG: TraB/GumN family protein [Candidatus Diapherotrites archaeon]|uniref:TraB/GumN family protein n=1 Tax=Candidatus Iainarchaeum sp. TaxID=3101447 RepID=A0A8T4C633_9ARCH|nr:TraB/GumN family protein [Candidatus Diapherotrites archaeon]